MTHATTQEAQIHAQEARTANATIAQIYQLCTGATGEPGNWNGAEPVRAALAAKDAEIARLSSQLESIGAGGVGALMGAEPNKTVAQEFRATEPSPAAVAAPVTDAEPVHWRAILDPEQVSQQLQKSMHVVGFRNKRDAESWIATKLDFDGWRYTLEALYAASRAPVALGAGWRAVPIEPTGEMTAAADEEKSHCHRAGRLALNSNIYRAMLAAAPQPEQAQGDAKDALIMNAGNTLANAAFNLSQQGGKILEDRTANTLKRLQIEWDAAILAQGGAAS